MTNRFHRSRILPLLAILVACPVAPPSDSGTGDTQGVDPNAVQAIAIDAQVVEAVKTVIEVNWQTIEDAHSWIEFGSDQSMLKSTHRNDEMATEHSALLLGMPADTDVFYRVVTESADGTITRGEEAILTTGSLPPAFPQLQLTEGSEPLGTYFATTVTGAGWGPVIYDEYGRAVWYSVEDRGFNVYRARMARDGKAILYNAVGVGNIDLIKGSEIVRVGLDGTREASYNLPFMTHDFIELPNGNLIAIAYDSRPVDGVEIRGDQLVEIDVTSGDTSVVWSTWDDFEVGVHGYDDGDDTWTHANALDYSEADDSIYVSIRDMGSIVKIDRQTGDILWGISGQANSFTFEGEGQGWEIEHQFQFYGDRMMVFDNGDSERASSYIQEYQLDLETMTAERTWFHEANPPCSSTPWEMWIPFPMTMYW